MWNLYVNIYVHIIHLIHTWQVQLEGEGGEGLRQEVGGGRGLHESAHEDGEVQEEVAGDVALFPALSPRIQPRAVRAAPGDQITGECTARARDFGEPTHDEATRRSPTR